MFSNVSKVVLASLVFGMAILAALSPSSAQDRGSMSEKQSSTKRLSVNAASSDSTSTGSVNSTGAKSTPTKIKMQQDGAKSKIDSAKSAATSANTKSSPSNKASGNVLRLPRYFSGIVDQEQREQIQAIQLEFRTKIEELEKELARVRQDEMQSLEKVLTESQRKLLEKKRAQGKSKPGDAEVTESM